MFKYARLLMVFAACCLVIGCMGGKSRVSLSEEALDSLPMPFIFAESKILDIDSDLMASRFRVARPPGTDMTIDSAAAEDMVYQILMDSILGQDAAKYDLETENKILFDQYRGLEDDKVLRLMFKDVIVDPIVISDSAITATYENNYESYLMPEKYRARHIVVAGDAYRHSADSLLYKDFTDEQLDSTAHAVIVELRERLLGGANFDTLAMLYSQDNNTAELGGDLGYFKLDQMVAPFDSAIEHTPVGEISGPVKTQYGWHVLKVEDHSPEHYNPLDSVYAQIEYQLKEAAVRERSSSYVDSVRSAGALVFDTAGLEMPDSLHESDDPMVYINPDDTEFGNDTLYFKDYQGYAYNYKKFHKIEGELTPEQKIEILTQISTQKMLFQAARKMGYYEYPEVLEWADYTIKKYLVSTLRKPIIEAPYEPTEEEMQAYYDAHLNDYVVERPYTVQHIVFADSNLAEHVRDLLMSGYDFMEMVDQYYPGDPEIRRAAADLGTIGPNDMPAEFYSMVKRTPVGSISHPVKTEYGYHLIKVVNMEHSLGFEQAKTKIRGVLLAEHRKKVIRDFVLKRLGKKPKIHWEYISKLYYGRPDMPDFSQYK